MKRGGWITCALTIASASWAFLLTAQPIAGSLVEVHVRGVTVDPQAGSPIVLLEEFRGARVMPIWVGMFEARAIALEMEKVVPPRPMTHDLLKNIIEGVKAQVTNIVITDLKDNTFYARIALTAGGTTIQIDARPSDAIALALRMNVPIFVAKTVFDSAPAIELHVDVPAPGPILKRYGLTLQNLTAPLAAHFHLPTTDGVLVSDVEAGSAAEQDGLHRGDVIVTANQVTITDLHVFESTLSHVTNVSLRVVRDHKHITVVLHKLAP